MLLLQLPVYLMFKLVPMEYAHAMSHILDQVAVIVKQDTIMMEVHAKVRRI